MRRFTFALPMVVLIALLGCKDEVLTGPKAQAAVAEALAVSEPAPERVIIFVDGERIVDNGSIADVADITGLTSDDVVRVEVLKGEPAVALVPGESVKAVVQIYTGAAGS